MSKQKNLERRNSLRAHAEAMVRDLSATDKTMLTEILTHELLVHKVELEMQNEELRRAQLVIEEARDRYIDLYEFAPVAYITLNAGGTINAINMTGALQLGMDRAKLINQRFSTFVSDTDKDRWYRLFISLMKPGTQQDYPQKTRLTMLRQDHSTFDAFLCCIVKETSDSPPLLRIALMDMPPNEQ